MDNQQRSSFLKENVQRLLNIVINNRHKLGTYTIMNKRDKSILLALAIGDGHLEKISRNAVRIAIKHSAKQKEYLLYKQSLLHSIIGGKKTTISKRTQVRTVNLLTSYGFKKGHRYFRVLRKWLYKDGVKTLSRNILNKLTPEAIAIWYMDDGNLYKHRYKGKVTSFRLTLSTEVPMDEAILIRDYFKEVFDISFHINKTKDGRYRHRCSTKEARKFFDLVEPFIIPSMMYKIDVPNYIRHERLPSLKKR